MFDKAADWIRYDAQGWVLYTSIDLDVWRDRVRKVPGVNEDTSFFLVVFNRDETSGYMTQSFWDWLSKHRE